MKVLKKLEDEKTQYHLQLVTLSFDLTQSARPGPTETMKSIHLGIYMTLTAEVLAYFCKETENWAGETG